MPGVVLSRHSVAGKLSRTRYLSYLQLPRATWALRNWRAQLQCPLRRAAALQPQAKLFSHRDGPVAWIQHHPICRPQLDNCRGAARWRPSVDTPVDTPVDLESTPALLRRWVFGCSSCFLCAHDQSDPHPGLVTYGVNQTSPPIPR
ncbi:uncharacterized protein JN550_005877 [Neoarthrinium moseri]|uniref:uncharacterized protein n=1 Tax=Neoarthrinium moseri TaxID=1658444 RepID=UPI001FDBCE9B|nr:uncharacterized protein JN550_005877 [Neoarthrinium moseri]KAI1869247.1 hypothetical protein JN550_005877 [Neoarthrinium moseri]